MWLLKRTAAWSQPTRSNHEDPYVGNRPACVCDRIEAQVGGNPVEACAIAYPSGVEARGAPRTSCSAAQAASSGVTWSRSPDCWQASRARARLAGAGSEVWGSEPHSPALGVVEGITDRVTPKQRRSTELRERGASTSADHDERNDSSTLNTPQDAKHRGPKWSYRWVHSRGLRRTTSSKRA
jgi:hypothetical protein